MNPTPSEWRKTSGFTLIELAIVLVIIGLIVGGILVGQDLIEAAQIRAVVKQEQQILTAISTFHSKYDCLPGDCINGDSLGFTNNTTNISINGDGNGIISDPNGTMVGFNPPGGGSGTPYTPPYNETISLWSELSEGGMLSDYPYINNGTAGQTYFGVPAPLALQPYGYGFPSNIESCAWVPGYAAHSGTDAFGGTIWPPPMPGIPALGNVISLVGGTNKQPYWTNALMNSECLTPEQAADVDAKTDDGLPLTGAVRATCASTNLIDCLPQSTSNGSPVGELCADNTNSIDAPYASPLTNMHPRCNLIIKMND